MEKLIRKTNKQISECAKAQADYQDKNNQPDFAPHNGICWNCHENIYQNIGYKKDPDSIWSMGIKCTIDGEMVDHVYGISLEKASTQLITGCPHCCRSYCD